jgi:DNA recombination protein RmuC
MTAEQWVMVAAAAAVVAALAAIAGLLRRGPDMQAGLDRLERGLKDDLARQREELRRALDGVQSGQRDQLDVLTRQLADGVANLVALSDRRQAAMQAAVDLKLDQMRGESGHRLGQFAEGLTATLREIGDKQRERLDAVTRALTQLAERQEAMGERLRTTVEERLDKLRVENGAKLDEMRQTVDEKLQGTLEKRLGESFQLVSERLEQVHKGLGEMQSLALGVGDLKRVLTNVKTRGTWGEVQLGSLLDQVLTPEQFARNVATRPGSAERVEFAIRLPGAKGETDVLLPIDAKFPQEDYERLLDAIDRADAEAMELSGRELEKRIRVSAREIRDKYVEPPHTTDFAILFLPTEGLYAEVLRRPGLIERLQTELRIVTAGPTTLAALLNSLQMGFKTLAIQQRSSEVWQVLSAVKTEFGKYGEVLAQVQKKLGEASASIDKVAVRKRAIDRQLRGVAELPAERAEAMLGIGVEDEVAPPGL